MLERSCWIINNERIRLSWAYGKHLKIMRWQPATNGNHWFDGEHQRDEKLLHREDRRKLGSLINTIIATFLREGFRWNLYRANSNEEIDGFKIPHSWEHVNQETQTQNHQEWHNTTSNDKVEWIALRNARWRMLDLHKTKHVLGNMFIL